MLLSLYKRLFGKDDELGDLRKKIIREKKHDTQMVRQLNKEISQIKKNREIELVIKNVKGIVGEI